MGENGCRARWKPRYFAAVRARRWILGLAVAWATWPGPVRAGLERLGEPARFRHCTVAGESRPASACVAPVLLTTHKGRRIPASGELVVRLPAGPRPPGPHFLEIEAYPYRQVPPTKVARTILRSLAKGLATARGHGALGHVLHLVSDAEAIPQPLVVADAALPATVVLRAPGLAPDTRVAFAVWAWPAAVADVDVALPDLPPGTRLSLAAAAQDVATAGLPPVALTAELVDPAGERPAVALWQRTLDPAAQEADRGWQDATIDLAPWSGGRYALRLRARATTGAPALHAATFARPILHHAAATPDERPSVLLLSLDTLRADHLGAYGQRRATTPRLDALAAASTIFERTYSTFPSTTGAHMSMLTSLPPCAHGVTVPNVTLAPTIPTLAELLAARGYATVGITEDALIKGEAGFDRGFDRYRDLPPYPPGGLGAFHTGIALAERWLEQRGREPFFLFLHTYQPHTPYKKPPHLRSLFTAPPGAPEWQREEADYDIGLRYTDELLGGFLDFLASHDLLQHIVLIVTSDHGTEFGERGGFGHAKGVHTEQLHVPLIMHHPSLGRGRRVAALTSIVDVPPTVLELAGAPVPPAFSGVSLVPQLRGESARAGRQVFGEQLWGPRQTGLRDGTHTWIETTGGVALYRDASDRWEQHDLAAEEPALASRGAGVIAAFRERCQTEKVELGRAPVVADPERLRALRALGYVE
jgi:arylsulfatase A-like enzyme